MKYTLIILLFISFIGCKPTKWTVTDTKFYHEQYLCTNDMSYFDVDRLKSQFKKAGFTVQMIYQPNNSGYGPLVLDYMMLKPEMIEYVKPNGKGILKKRHIKRLRNTL